MDIKTAMPGALSWFAAALLACGTVQGAERCDRSCLEGFLDTYVDAVIAHDAARLPGTADLKFTENGQRLELGDGLWNTATGKGGYALKLADVEHGQAVLMGTIREADAPTLLVVRLRVADRKIAEVETLVIRNREAAESLDAIGAPRRTWYEAVPASERLPRAELVRIANAYFSGIERNDGKGDYPIADDCARLENGVVTAGDPALVSSAVRARRDGPQLGCRDQFEKGMFHYVTRIRDRRFVMVDPERSLAFAFAFFDNAAGAARHGTLADGRRVESGPSVPFTWQIAEVFKIERGKIGPVESVLHSVPYGMASGWSEWRDAMSSPPRG
jgi:hypothetical protein